MNTGRSTGKRHDIGNLLLDSHHRIEMLLREAAGSIGDDERSSIGGDCARLERELLQHMDWEEMYMLPLFEAQKPQLVQSIRDDHARFRQALGELTIEADLHLIRAERFERFADLLMAHAQREQELYATLENEMNKEHKDSALRRLRRWMA